MSQARTCPVCGRPGLPPNCGSCPQCDADLTCFQALDSLSSPAATHKTAKPVRKQTPWAAVALLAVLVVLLLAGLAASMKSRLSELDRELAAMRAKREQQQLPKPVPVAEPALPPESTIDNARTAAEQVPAAQTASSQEAVTTESGTVAPQQPAEQASKIEPSNPVASEAEAQQEAAPVAAEQQTEQPAATPQAQAGEGGKKPSSLLSGEPAPSGITLPSGASAQPPVKIQPVLRKRRMPQHEAAASKLAQSSEEARQPSTLLAGSIFSYAVKERESVWDIAERFYGDRKYYPVVMELNPHIFLGFTRKNSEVWLYADRREAASLYQRRIEQKEGLLLWNYEVRPGETWRSIYARFFLSRQSGTVFYGDQEVAPGRTVKIILR